MRLTRTSLVLACQSIFAWSTLGIALASETQIVEVIFDPGHGGTPGEPYPNDVGSLTPIGDYYEKDVNLQVALELKDTLDAHYWMEDIHYHFTRTTDTALERTERARIANTWGDEESRFVSIHHNSAPTCPTSQRTETLYSALSHCDGCGDDWPWCNVVRNTSDTLAKKLG
jgi:N-acetylmuramoyl-L-alanine amidase